MYVSFVFFFFQAEDGIRDVAVTGVQTCALPICEVAAALAVPLDVIAVLDLVVPVQRGAPGGNDGVAERSPVALDRQERVHRALQCDQRPGDVAVRRDLAEPRR